MIYLVHQSQLQGIISGVLLNTMGLNDTRCRQHHK